SSYLWRNIIPPLQGVGRCLAPDLIGMGRSGKAPGGRYRFADHARYLDAWFEVLALRDVTLVVHDWGSALGFDWARRHPERVRALVYMEAIVRPMTWPEWPETARAIFQAMRSPAGEEIVLQKNVFVERILPASVLRGLSNEEMDKYREPFRQAGESRRPTLTWPREIPIDGEPADVAAIVSAYAEWLSTSPLPKLFINAEPGSILVGAQRVRRLGEREGHAVADGNAAKEVRGGPDERHRHALLIRPAMGRRRRRSRRARRRGLGAHAPVLQDTVARLAQRGGLLGGPRV